MVRESDFGGFHRLLVDELECERINLEKDRCFLMSFDEFETIH